MKVYGFSRNGLYERVELARMRALPSDGDVLVKRYQLQVGANGHVYLGGKKQYYSVPYRLIGQCVQVVVTHNLVKVYHQSKCVVTHAVSAM